MDYADEMNGTPMGNGWVPTNPDEARKPSAAPSIPKSSAPPKSLYTSRVIDKFDSKKYNIANYSYPEDVMGTAYGNNYAVFYINVAEDSKLFNDKTVETVKDYSPRDRGQLIALNSNLYSDPTSAGAKTGVVAAGAAAQALKGGFIGALAGGKTGAAIASTVAAAPEALMIGAAATQAASVTRSQKRLKTAIALHIPNQLSVRYSTNWGDEDTFNYQAVAAGAEAVSRAMQVGGIDGLKSLGGDAAAILGAKGLQSGSQGASASASLGLAANPKKEQLFKGVDFRTFQFDYQFFPRDISEADNVLRIIQEFKYHMHPEFKDTNNFLYVYPSEFDIFYYQNGKENMNVHRHTSCVLKELNINYTPNGVFTTFANGMPTQINIQLTFVELALMDKEKIKNGL